MSKQNETTKNLEAIADEIEKIVSKWSVDANANVIDSVLATSDEKRTLLGYAEQLRIIANELPNGANELPNGKTSKQKYEVAFNFVQYSRGSISIEADSLEEAQEKAEQIDASNLELTPIDGELTVDYIMPI